MGVIELQVSGQERYVFLLPISDQNFKWKKNLAILVYFCKSYSCQTTTTSSQLQYSKSLFLLQLVLVHYFRQIFFCITNEKVRCDLLSLPDPLPSGIDLTFKMHQFFVERLRGGLDEVKVLIVISGDESAFFNSHLLFKQGELLILLLVGQIL